jgi:hypothetical protein
MDFGIVTAKIDEIGFITRAENLGYSHAWVTDSPMISLELLGSPRVSRSADPDHAARDRP